MIKLLIGCSIKEVEEETKINSKSQIVATHDTEIYKSVSIHSISVLDTNAGLSDCMVD